MMQGVAIAAAIKEILISRQFNPFFQTGTTQCKVTPVTKAEIVCPEFVFPVTKRDTFSVPASKNSWFLPAKCCHPPHSGCVWSAEFSHLALACQSPWGSLPSLSEKDFIGWWCRVKIPQKRSLLGADQQRNGLRGSAPGPSFDWGSLTEPIHSLCPTTELIRATPGSAGVDSVPPPQQY